MAFGVQQKRPATLDEAVSLTLEMEAYMLPLTRAGTISTILQEEEQAEGATVTTVDPSTKLITLLEQLVICVENLEQERRSLVDRVPQPVPMNRKQHPSRSPFQQSDGRRRSFSGSCWRC